MERYIRGFLALVIVLFFLAVFVMKPMLRLVYPIHYQEVIVSQATERELDPFLVAAMVQAESGFRPEAVSVKGAVGLMQLMPDTATWVAEQLRIPFQYEQLTDPEINIMLGTEYLRYLITQFNSLPPAVAAYNGGQGNVRQWLDNGRWDGSLGSVADIPFYETRNYVRKVFFHRDLFRLIHDDKRDVRGEFWQ